MVERLMLAARRTLAAAITIVAVGAVDVLRKCSRYHHLANAALPLK